MWDSISRCLWSFLLPAQSLLSSSWWQQGEAPRGFPQPGLGGGLSLSSLFSSEVLEAQRGTFHLCGKLGVVFQGGAASGVVESKHWRLTVWARDHQRVQQPISRVLLPPAEALACGAEAFPSSWDAASPVILL